MVIPQVLDENLSLFFILTRFLHNFSECNGKENNAVAMVTYKISFFNENVKNEILYNFSSNF